MTDEQMQTREMLGPSLEDLMSDISEDCYCAGWLCGLEYYLWRFAFGDNVNRWAGIEQKEIDRLKFLSAAINGWYWWPESANDPVFITCEEWVPIYEKWLEKDRAAENRV